MRPYRFTRAPLPLALALALPGQAGADSGDGVDLAPGNALLARGLLDEAADARGTSWLRPGQRRSPAGHLYGCPLEVPTPEQLGEWTYDGRMQLGWIGTYGDTGNALWNRYVRWDSGMVLGLLELALRRPADGSYADLRASRISSDDGFIEAAF